MSTATTSERPSLWYLIIDRLTQPQFLLASASGFFLWWLARSLLSGGIPDEARELVAALVGFISGQMVGPGWQFYFGNTKASDEKTRALSDNAATLRQAGIPVGREPSAAPIPTVPINPAFANMTDDELISELIARQEDPMAVTRMDRNGMLARLTELDPPK